MTKVQSAPTLSDAKKWCIKAREILNVGLFSRDSYDFKSNAKSVAANLGKLKKSMSSEAYATLEKQFRELAGQIKEAAEAGDIPQSEVNSKRLELLRCQTEVILKDNSSNQKDLAKAREELKATCLKALPQAVQAFEDQLNKTDAALINLFQLQVPANIFNGHSEVFQLVRAEGRKSVDEVSDTTTITGTTIDAALTVIRSSTAKLADREQKIANTHRVMATSKADCETAKKECQKSLDKLNEFALAKDLSGRTEFEQIDTNLAKGFDYDKGKVAFTDLNDRLVKLYGGLKSLGSTYTSFKKAYESSADQLWEVEKLRGADAEPIKGYIVEIKEIRERARLEVEKSAPLAAKTEVQAAERSLQLIGTIVEKAKQAAEKAKESFQQDLKSIGQYESLLRAAGNARIEIDSLPGAESKVTELDQLIIQARALVRPATGSEGQLVVGHAQAVEKLKGYEKIVNDARNLNKEFLQKGVDDSVILAMNKVFNLLESHAQLAPSFATGIFRDELNDHVQLGRTDPGTAVSKLEELGKAILGSTQELQNQKTTAEEDLRKFNELIGKMTTAHVPQMIFAEFERLGKQTEAVELAERDWRRASLRFQQAISGLEEIMARHKEHGDTWAAVLKNLDDVQKLTSAAIHWPPLAGSANTLNEDRLDLLKQLGATHDFKAAITSYTTLKIAKRYDDLRQKFESLDKTDPEMLREFVAGLRDANDAVRDARNTTNVKLHEIEFKLAGLSEKTGTSLHKRRDDIWNRWESYFNAPPKPELVEVARQERAAIDNFAQLQRDIEKLLSKKQELASFITVAKREEAKNILGRVPEVIEGLLSKLEARGIDVALQRRQFDVSVKAFAPTSDEGAKSLELLRVELQALLDEQLKADQEKIILAQGELKANVTDRLKQIKGRHKGFELYEKQLNAEAEDLQSMIASGDPYLLEMAKEEMAKLAGRVAKVHPDLRGKDAVRFNDVTNKWGELSKILGKKDTVKTYLADTHQRLNADLNAAIGEAKRTGPEEGLALFTAVRGSEPSLEQAILAAYEKAKAVAVEVENFKKRKSEIEDLWTKTKKETKTWITEKTDGFNSYLEARLNDATSASKAENGLPNAYKILDTAEKMLNNVLQSENPRETLRELDGKYEQEARLVRDMARAFEADVTNFKEHTLKEVKSVVSQSEEGDLDTLASLKKVADAAAKIVEPYLNTLSVNPVKKVKSTPSPELSNCQSDFKRARGMLNDAIATAERLRNVSSTTNVVIVEDLKKVHEHWIAQTRLFATTARTMANAVRSAAGDEPEDVKKAAEKAATMIEQAGRHFRADSFAEAFAVLTQAPKSKEEKAKLEKQKLKAREDALRIMRLYRNDVLKHPILTKLTDKSVNPFDATSMMAATGQIRVSLKRIEIETLIGV